MATPFPNLFRPIQVGPFTLKNRIAVAPHGPMYGVGGVLTQQYVDYEVEKAKGGAGLIIMSCGLADPDAKSSWGPWPALVQTWRRENIPYFREIVEGAHAHDCRVFFQFGENALTTKMAVSAYPHTGVGGLWSREMTLADIQGMMDKYARCAEILVEAGLDGIEMHGHGDFFSDFFSPVINRRSDRYGGSRENRVRFFNEAAAVLRGVLGRERVLGARVSVDDCIPGSLPLEEGVAVAGLIAGTGSLDYLNIDTTIEPQAVHRMIAPMYAEPGYELYASDAVKAAVKNIPIFTVGRIIDPAFAEAILAEGRADVITMARALIADPELPNKAREGRIADIRPCLGDNQECMGRILQALPMHCTVNPAAGNETRWGLGRIRPAARRQKIVVVGGGPAGMEAARVAAERGHAVHLYERDEALGGQVLLAERLPGRADIGRFLPWHRRQLERLGVTVSLGVAADLAAIERQEPDVVVLATGSHWEKSGYNGLNFQETPGSEQANVLSLTDVVSGAAQTGERVIVYDLNGFVQAPGVAELLAGQGRQVEIITPFPKLGVVELDLTLQTPYLMSRLLAAQVPIAPDSMIASIAGTTVTVVNVHGGRPREISGVDNVVIVSGRAPEQTLHAALAGSSLDWRQIGDCESPANIGKAFRDAWTVGAEL
jgi:2,4-dienoyl-CoA reductase-like NADH-dependent reductase (Old Yellow Enzyme family)